MEKLSYNLNTLTETNYNRICQSLTDINKNNSNPIIICIGSDLVLGDSLGPLVGTLLKNKKISSYVYGSLAHPITAKEIKYVKAYLSYLHPTSPIIAIDAAIGNAEDVGTIKVAKGGIAPGLGVNKYLGEIGDISIIGIVAKRSEKNYNLFNMTRLNLVYKMAQKIADGIGDYIGLLSAIENKRNKNSTSA